MWKGMINPILSYPYLKIHELSNLFVADDPMKKKKKKKFFLSPLWAHWNIGMKIAHGLEG